MSRRETQQAVRQRERKAVSDTTNPPPPPLLPPPFVQQVTVRELYRCFNPQRAAPLTVQQLFMASALTVQQAAPFNYRPPCFMRPGPVYGQTGVYFQGQHLPHQWSLYGPGAAAFCAPPQLTPAAAVNRQTVFTIHSVPFAPPPPPPPPPKPPTYQTRNVEVLDGDQPYIKKPPNAFFLFKKEKWQSVVSELLVTDSAAIVTILAQRWRSLSEEDKNKYFKEAERQRRLHAKQFPHWSNSDNYGKSRKRDRRMAPATNRPQVIADSTKKLCVTAVQTAVKVIKQPTPASVTANTSQDSSVPPTGEEANYAFSTIHISEI